LSFREYAIWHGFDGKHCFRRNFVVMNDKFAIQIGVVITT